MVKRILETTLLPESKQTVRVKVGAWPISVQLYHNNIVMWYLYDTENDDLGEFDMIIKMYGIGEEFETEKFDRYIGTVIDSNGVVWHINQGKSSAVKSAEDNMKAWS